MKYIFSIALTAILFSCTSSPTQKKEASGSHRELVIRKTPGKLGQPWIMTKIIQDTIQIDSNGQKKIVTAKIWATQEILPDIDSITKIQKKDSAGNLLYRLGVWQRVPDEEVITDIEGKDYDSLIAIDTLPRK